MGSSLLDAILDWMQVNRLRLCSYERLVSSIPGVSTYDELATIVGNNPGIFRPANIKNVGPGLALVDGYQFPTLVEPVTMVDLSTGQISTAPAVDAPVPSDPPPRLFRKCSSPRSSRSLSCCIGQPTVTFRAVHSTTRMLPRLRLLP